MDFEYQDKEMPFYLHDEGNGTEPTKTYWQPGDGSSMFPASDEYEEVQGADEYTSACPLGLDSNFDNSEDIGPLFASPSSPAFAPSPPVRQTPGSSPMPAISVQASRSPSPSTQGPASPAGQSVSSSSDSSTSTMQARNVRAAGSPSPSTHAPSSPGGQSSPLPSDSALDSDLDSDSDSDSASASASDFCPPPPSGSRAANASTSGRSHAAGPSTNPTAGGPDPYTTATFPPGQHRPDFVPFADARVASVAQGNRWPIAPALRDAILVAEVDGRGLRRGGRRRLSYAEVLAKYPAWRAGPAPATLRGRVRAAVLAPGQRARNPTLGAADRAALRHAVPRCARPGGTSWTAVKAAVLAATGRQFGAAKLRKEWAAMQPP